MFSGFCLSAKCHYSETPMSHSCLFTAVCGGSKSKYCVIGNFCLQTTMGAKLGWRFLGISLCVKLLQTYKFLKLYPTPKCAPSF